MSLEVRDAAGGEGFEEGLIQPSSCYKNHKATKYAYISGCTINVVFYVDDGSDLSLPADYECNSESCVKEEDALSCEIQLYNQVRSIRDDHIYEVTEWNSLFKLSLKQTH